MSDHGRRPRRAAAAALALLAALALAGCDPVVVQPPPPLTPGPATPVPAATRVPVATPAATAAALPVAPSPAPSPVPEPAGTPAAAVAACGPVAVGTDEQLGTILRVTDERPAPGGELWLTWSRIPRAGVDDAPELAGAWCRLPAGGTAELALGGDDTLARVWVCDASAGSCGPAEAPDGHVYAELDPSFTGDLTTCTALSDDVRICKSGVGQEVDCPCDLGDGTRIVGSFRFERLLDDAWPEVRPGPYADEWPKVILRVRSVI